MSRSLDSRFFARFGAWSAPLCLLPVVWILCFPQSYEKRYLVIHSDDAGFCAATNAATVQAMENGSVSSASIMVPLPGFPEIAAYAVAHPEKDFGIHLTLTSETPYFRWGPVLKDRVPTLVQKDGSFWRTSEDVAAHADAREVGMELEAQIQMALAKGIRITHLDHHMWVMLQKPEFLKVYLELGLKFGLPVRLHRQLTVEETGELLRTPEEYQAIIQSATARNNPLFDVIETNNYDVAPDQKRNYFLNALRGLKPGNSEFCIHCSEMREGALLPPHAARRQADLTVFTSDEIQDEIQRLGIRVVSWDDLQRLEK